MLPKNPSITIRPALNQLSESVYIIDILQYNNLSQERDHYEAQNLQSMISFLYMHNPIHPASVSVEIQAAGELQLMFDHAHDCEVHHYLFGNNGSKKVSEFFPNRAILLCCERYLGYVINSLIRSEDYDNPDIEKFIFSELKAIYMPDNETTDESCNELLRGITSVINSALDVSENRHDQMDLNEIAALYSDLLLDFYKLTRCNPFKFISATVNRSKMNESSVWDGNEFHDMLFFEIYNSNHMLALSYLDYLRVTNQSFKPSIWAFSVLYTNLAILNMHIQNKEVRYLTSRNRQIQMIVKMCKTLNISYRYLLENCNQHRWFIVYLKLRYHLK